MEVSNLKAPTKGIGFEVLDVINKDQINKHVAREVTNAKSVCRVSWTQLCAELMK